jgi:HEAT repeat protein/Tfp pilus assembly protein PilF
MRNPGKKFKSALLIPALLFLAVILPALCWSASLEDTIAELWKKGGGTFGVAEEVAKIDDPRLVDKLIASLSHKENKAIAAYALGLIGDKRAFKPLVRMLHNDRSFARAYAALALGYLGDVRAVDELINVTGGDHSVFAKDNTPSWATSALGRLGTKKAIDFLIWKLNDADKDFRSNAARALGDSGSKRAVAPLIKAFQDDRLNLQFHAGALGKIGGDKALQFLMGALQDKTSGNRQGAASALGLAKDKRAVDPLIQLLAYDKDQFVRSDSALALANIGDKRAVEALIRALGDKKYYVRKNVARALGDLGDTRAIEPLKGMLGDSVDDVRKAGKKALAKLKVSEEEIKKGALGARDSLNALVEELKEDSNICNGHFYHDRRMKAIELSLTITPAPAVSEKARRQMVQGTTAFRMASDSSGYNEAREYFERAIKLVPWWADPYLNLGLANEKLRKYESAIDCLKYYLAAAPGASDTETVREKIYKLEFLQKRKEKAKNHTLWARDLVQSKDYAKAAHEARQAIKLDPDFGSAHGWLGLAYVKQGMYKQAIVELAEAIRLGTPDSLDSLKSSCVLYTNLGWTYHKLGNLKKAIITLEEGDDRCVYGRDELKKFLYRYKKEAGM